MSDEACNHRQACWFSSRPWNSLFSCLGSARTLVNHLQAETAFMLSGCPRMSRGSQALPQGHSCHHRGLGGKRGRWQAPWFIDYPTRQPGTPITADTTWGGSGHRVPPAQCSLRMLPGVPQDCPPQRERLPHPAFPPCASEEGILEVSH